MLPVQRSMGGRTPVSESDSKRKTSSEQVAATALRDLGSSFDKKGDSKSSFSLSVLKQDKLESGQIIEQARKEGEKNLPQKLKELAEQYRKNEREVVEAKD